MSNVLNNEAAIPHPEADKKITSRNVSGLLSRLYDLSSLTPEEMAVVAKLNRRTFAEQRDDSALKLAREMEQILRENSFLSNLYERASEKPAKLVASAISGHQRTIDAVDVAMQWQLADITFIGPETLKDNEKEQLSQVFSETMRQRLESKREQVIRAKDQYLLIREAWLSQGNPEEGPLLITQMNAAVNTSAEQIRQIDEQLVTTNFLSKARALIFGPIGPVYQSTLKTIRGEFEGVVGGGDCPSKDFINALINGNPIRSGTLMSTYFITGPKPDRYHYNFQTGQDGRISPGTLLAVTDPALHPTPTPEERALAALATAKLFAQLAPTVPPKIGFLSYATGPSGVGTLTTDDRAAYEAYNQMEEAVNFSAYGPIQFDAAINQEVAKDKRPSFESAVQSGKIPASELEAYLGVAGAASVLSVHDLDGGNTLIKTMHQLWERSIQMGPLIIPADRLRYADGTGTFVASDLSRGELRRSILSTFAALSVMRQSAL